MSLVEYEDIKNLIRLYFNQDQVLFNHLFSSFNQLIEEIIPFTLIKENNYFYENVDKTDIYLHGFRCKNIRLKPVVFDNNPNEIMYPDQARKNHLNYFAHIYADIEQVVERINVLTGETTIKVVTKNSEEDPIAIASVPIMVKSKYCSTTIKKDSHNECKYDPGGYFIVNGKEKVVMSIEKMVDNKPLVFTKKESSFPRGYFYTCQINSKANDWSDNLQILNIKERKDSTFIISTSQLSDIKIIVLMRALGLETDQDIISNFCYSLDDINMINLIKPSIDNSVDDEGNIIRTKDQAIDFLITKLRRNKRFSQTDEELADKQKKIFLEKIFRKDLLPHLGEDIKLKIRYISYMFNKMFKVMLNREEPDDRDALQNKRIETPGVLIGQLFRQNWKKLLNEIGKNFKKKNQSDENPVSVINQIKPNAIEQGIKTALSTGIWGMNKTKKGVAQALQRLSWFGSNSYLRRVMAPSLDASTANITKIRLVNSLQAQFLCLTKDSIVLLNDRYSSKPISKLTEADKVISLTKDMNEEPTKIFNNFERMADDIKKIVTISGREIKATNDHPFLVKRQDNYEWIQLKDINESDLLVIRNCDNYIEEDTMNYINIDVTNEEIIKPYIRELTELGYIETTSSSDKLYLKLDIQKQKMIARLIASLNTDGNINLKDKKYYAVSFNLGEEQDIFDVNDDINRLGFGGGTISRRTTKLVDKYSNRETIFKTWRLDKGGPFAGLITFMGGFTGNKVKTVKFLPDWISNNQKSVKREFLSGLQGGDGCRLSVQHNNENDKVCLGEFKQTCVSDTLRSTISYMDNINKLFSEFNIISSVHHKEKEEKDKFEVSIRFSQTTENLEKLVSNIGYRYCEEKRRKSAIPLEYCKIRVFNKNLVDQIKDNVLTLHKEGKKPAEIVKETELTYNFVTKTLRQFKEDRLSNSRYITTISYDELLKNSLPNGCIAVPIYKIDECEPEMVYDFTTVSDNHNFIANSFVTHNCPTETPEGQNIGIIKSLSMSATITMQNSSQLEIVKEIIKQFGKSELPTNIDPLDIPVYGKVFMNGNWIAVTKEPYELYTILKRNRQEGVLDKFTTVYLDFMKKEICIFSDGGRMIRPILQVENNKVNMTKEVLAEINRQVDTTSESNSTNKGNSWNILMDRFPNLLEYEDIETSGYLMIAQTPYDLESNETNKNRDLKHKDINDVNRYGDYRYVNYTHCDIHPWLMLGYVVCSIPFSNHNFGLKNIIFFSQAKQSIGIYLTSYKDRMDISQVLYHPQVPLVTTEGMRINNSMDLPFGENVVIAIMSYMGYNQEDSIIFNKASVDRGLFLCDSLKKEHAEIVKNPSTSQDDVFTKPDSNKVTGMQQGNYDKLNEKGFIPEETIINNQDIIIGKVSPIQPTGTNNKVYKDNSVQFKSNVEGVIDRVHTGVYNNDGYEMYNVRLRMERIPIIGDKFCLTDDHEVLTSDGWKQINRVTTDDTVCCLNPEDNTIVYNKPSETYKFDHEGEMYSLKSQQVDLVTTMNHKMYVKKRDRKSFELIEAKDINGKRVSYKKNGINNQRELESFKVPNSEKILNMNDFLVFLGIWFAEGWTDKHNKRITISVNKKIVQTEIERVCNNLDIHIIKSNDKWHMHKIEIYNYLKDYSNGAVNKSLPKWVFNLNRDQSRILLESMLKGDGYKTKSNTCKYFTSSKQLKDDVQQLALHCEWSANIYERDMSGPYSINSKGKEIIPTTQAYELSIIKSKNTPTVNHGHVKTQNGQKEEIIDFKGKVYCLEVPSHIFYVRLNGKPVWTGNSNRHGQKGTLGILLPERDMPFTESGMVPDLIMNPHGIPSRMTHAQLLECLASKYGAVTGQHVDGTPFNNYNVAKLPDLLKSVGFNPYGLETMYCGITGKKMQSEIFIGPTYYMRLKHMVLDKVHSRSIGPKQAITRQPLEGRSRDGGLKIGEMEKDSMIAHGVGQFLKERLNEVSDITKVHICDDCGRFAAKVFDKDYYYCDGCDNSTRISAVSMPYACKLLFQEITSVNIQPRIRTRQSVFEASV